MCQLIRLTPIRCGTDSLFWNVASLVLLAVLCANALAQKSSGNTVPPRPVPPPPKPPSDSFDQHRLRYGLNAQEPRPAPQQDGTCFLPPISGVHANLVGLNALRVPTKAKKAYNDACSSIRSNKFDQAMQQLGKALESYSEYPAALVIQGQLFALRQNYAEARNSCSKALAADPRYVFSYLCLADVAARSNSWEEALTFSNRALELDATNDPVAYAYNALANFNLHRLAEAERSGLRSLEIDTNHNDPRVHFLLAQIYEAKGETVNEAAQLRAYLPFAKDPADAAMVKQYLSELEKK